MSLTCRSAFIAVAALAATPALAAPSSPRERYALDKSCTAVLEAAVARPDLAGDRDLSPVLTLYRQHLAASGGEAGVPPAAVARDVAALRRSIEARLADRRRAAAERADTADMAQKCTALPMFEVEDRIARAN